VCLVETLVDKNDLKELVKQCDNQIAVGEANELMSKGKDSKAENKLRKVLKKDSDYPQALYSMSKCLISQAKYGEAEYYIKILETKFPDDPEIKRRPTSKISYN
jgi:Tfp pilus assembly protein PilF